jgi:hypothetical protein
MHKTSRASTPRPMRRSVIWSSVVAASSTLVFAAGCQGQEPVAPGEVGASAGQATAAAGRVASGGAGGSGGKPAGSGGSAAINGGNPSSGGAPVLGSGGMSSGGVPAGGMSAGGSLVGSGGMNSAGAGTGGSMGGMSTGGVGGVAEPCMDREPPPDPTWPGATCENWALETDECSAGWFAEFCDVSCGRCVPEGGVAGMPGVDCSGEGLPNVNGGDGYATRYWDCCQTHCSQSSGHRCSQDGTSSTGSTQSACSGGDSFACYDEAPRAVSDCLSYGHIAKSNPNCGGCYRIQFTGQGEHNANDPGSKAIKGKQMIVKVTNTGGDVAGNQFDLMIPGGGVGQFNACSRQWGTSDLGAQYGGFLTECTGAHSAKKECVRQECMKIPAGKARDGCLWFVDWFQVADNPKFTSESTNCPF